MITHLHNVKTVKVEIAYSDFVVAANDQNRNEVGLYFNSLEEIKQFAQDILNQINKIKGSK